MASASASDAGSSDFAKLILRVTLGVLILLHGIAKIKGGPGFILDVVGKAGLPSFIAYLVYIGEVVAPVLLIIAVNMIFALALVHASQLFMLNQQGGWQLELQGMYLFTAVAIALMGAGRLSVGGAGGRWN